MRKFRFGWESPIIFHKFTRCLGITVLLMATPMLSWAGVPPSGCGGSIGFSSSPGTPIFVFDLPQTVQVTLTPAAGLGTLDIDVDELVVAMTCNNPGAPNNPGFTVPCAYGNDSQASNNPAATPIVFDSLVGGTCGVVSATPNVDGSEVTFAFPEAVISTAGCTIIYDVEVQDKGTDSNPLRLAQLAFFEGTCEGDLTGAAFGSGAINLLEPICEVESDVCVAVDTDDDGSFDDEECISDNIGLNATSDGDAKNFKYFVEGNLGSGADDLGGCQVQQLVDAEWVDVSDPFGLDSETPGDVFMTDGTDACSAEGDSRTYRIQCDTCDGFDLETTSEPDTADVECVDCAVEIEKTVSCDDGTTYGEECIGWDDDGETSFKYVVTNTGDVDVGSCVVNDEDAEVNPGNPAGPIAPGDSSADIIVNNAICQDGEGNSDGDVTCTCLPTVDGADLTVDNNRVGVNSATDPNATFGACSASDDDDANLICQSVNLSVSKTCDEQDETSGENAIAITVMNGGEATLSSCSVVDTLEGGADVPLTCNTQADGLGDDVNPADFSMAGGTNVYCTGTVAGLEGDTGNDVDVSCLVDGTDKEKTATDDDLCEVPEDGCLTRTPGFWGTHPHVTGEYLPLTVCGVELDNTDAGVEGSATEDMCWGGKDFKAANTSATQLQLYRQCTAAVLNIAASLAGEGGCGTEIDTVFESCCAYTEDPESLCGNAPTAGEINDSECIEYLDEFNNSEDTLDPFGPFLSPGPANSSFCREANGNGFVNTRDHGPKEGGKPASAKDADDAR